MLSEGGVYALAGVGVLTLAYYLFTFATTILNVSIRSGKSLSTYGAGNGAWAVITGASDGIGKEFAMQLAKQKFNVVILARTESKLQAIATEIQSKYGVEVWVIPFDFSTIDSSAYEKLLKRLSSLNISILVNNVGVSHDIPTPFLSEDPEFLQTMLNINITAAMRMTHGIAKQMKTSGHPGLVLNLSSFAGIHPMPLLSVYGATKAYLSSWSQAVAHELAPHRIDVICLNTYYVVSAMSKIKHPSWFVPTAQVFVRSVLERIGNEGGAGIPYVSSPYPSHALLNWLITNIGTPRLWIPFSHQTVQSIRIRALKKAKRALSSGDNQPIGTFVEE